MHWLVPRRARWDRHTSLATLLAHISCPFAFLLAAPGKTPRAIEIQPMLIPAQCAQVCWKTHQKRSAKKFKDAPVHEPQPRRSGSCARAAGAVQSITSGASTTPETLVQNVLTRPSRRNRHIPGLGTRCLSPSSFSNFSNDKTPEVVDDVAAFEVQIVRPRNWHSG